MKKVFLPLMAAALLISCNNQNNEVVPTGDEIMLSSAQKLITKTPYLNENTTPGTGTELFALVPICLSTSDYTSIYKNEITKDGGDFMNFVDGNATSFCDASKTKAPKYYPRGESQDMKLFGLYPVHITASADDFWTLTATGATATITGCEDVMVAKEVTTSKQLAETTPAQTLAFNHMLTQLKVKVAATDETAVESWEGIKKLELIVVGSGTEKPKTGITATASTGAVAFTGDGEELPFFEWTSEGFTDDKIVETSNEIALEGLITDYTKKDDFDDTKTYNAAYILCQPTTAVKDPATPEYKIRLTPKYGEPKEVAVDLMDETSTATAEVAFEGETAGHAFTITLIFDVDEIMAKATVSKWIEGGNTIIEIE